MSTLEWGVNQAKRILGDWRGAEGSPTLQECIVSALTAAKAEGAREALEEAVVELRRRCSPRETYSVGWFITWLRVRAVSEQRNKEWLEAHFPGRR